MPDTQHRYQINRLLRDLSECSSCARRGKPRRGRAETRERSPSTRVRSLARPNGRSSSSYTSSLLAGQRSQKGPSAASNSNVPLTSAKSVGYSQYYALHCGWRDGGTLQLDCLSSTFLLEARTPIAACSWCTCLCAASCRSSTRCSPRSADPLAESVGFTCSCAKDRISAATWSRLCRAAFRSSTVCWHAIRYCSPASPD